MGVSLERHRARAPGNRECRGVGERQRVVEQQALWRDLNGHAAAFRHDADYGVGLGSARHSTRVIRQATATSDRTLARWGVSEVMQSDEFWIP